MLFFTRAIHLKIFDKKETGENNMYAIINENSD